MPRKPPIGDMIIGTLIIGIIGWSPYITIWALNNLFNLQITQSIWSYLSMLWLFIVIYFLTVPYED